MYVYIYIYIYVCIQGYDITIHHKRISEDQWIAFGKICTGNWLDFTHVLMAILYGVCDKVFILNEQFE